MRSIYIKIKGMNCKNCEEEIKKSLSSIKNIKDIIFFPNVIQLKYEESINEKKIKEKLVFLGYEVLEISHKKIIPVISLYEFVIILLCILILNLLVKKIFNLDVLALIPLINDSVSIGMLFFVGLFTSVHCMQMCGAINLVASTSEENKYKNPLLYNVGRLFSYTLLGGLVGALGSVFELNSYLQATVLLLSSLFMFLFALSMMGIIRFALPMFKFKNKNSFVIGLLNGFMPCGPLQAMQLYALSTASFYTGALSMFVFCLGTILLMLSMGIVSNHLNSKIKFNLNKISSVLIIVLSFIMLSRGFLALGLDVTRTFLSDNEYKTGIMLDGYQVIKFDLSYSKYKDIKLEKDIPVRLIINVDEKHLNGCNNEILIKEYNIKQKLQVGENIIEFTPTKEGIYFYSCWMNMIKSQIKVVDESILDSCEENVCK